MDRFHNPLHLNLGTILAGNSSLIEITGTVDPSTPEGTIINNTATANTTTTPDPKVATTSTVVDPQSVLNVVKSGLSKVTAGVSYPLIYTITVTNNGPSDARDVRVTDKLPDQIVNTEYRINGGTWTSFDGALDVVIPYIANGTSSVIEIRGKISPSAAACSMSNMASASINGTTFDSNIVKTKINPDYDSNSTIIYVKSILIVSKESQSCADPTVKAARTTGMDPTGVPLAGFVVAVLMVLSGLIMPRKK